MAMWKNYKFNEFDKIKLQLEIPEKKKNRSNRRRTKINLSIR